jgi:hypothetical protein
MADAAPTQPQLIATNTYSLFQSLGVGTYSVNVPGSPEQQVTLLGIQVDGNNGFVYVRYNEPANPFRYLLARATALPYSAIPVKIDKGTKEVLVDISVQPTTVLLFFNVSDDPS